MSDLVNDLEKVNEIDRLMLKLKLQLATNSLLYERNKNAVKIYHEVKSLYKEVAVGSKEFYLENDLNKLINRLNTIRDHFGLLE